MKVDEKENNREGASNCDPESNASAGVNMADGLYFNSGWQSSLLNSSKHILENPDDHFRLMSQSEIIASDTFKYLDVNCLESKENVMKQNLNLKNNNREIDHSYSDNSNSNLALSAFDYNSKQLKTQIRNPNSTKLVFDSKKSHSKAHFVGLDHTRSELNSKKCHSKAHFVGLDHTRSELNSKKCHSKSQDMYSNCCKSELDFNDIDRKSRDVNLDCSGSELYLKNINRKSNDVDLNSGRYATSLEKSCSEPFYVDLNNSRFNLDNTRLELFDVNSDNFRSESNLNNICLEHQCMDSPPSHQIYRHSSEGNIDSLRREPNTHSEGDRKSYKRTGGFNPKCKQENYLPFESKCDPIYTERCKNQYLSNNSIQPDLEKFSHESLKTKCLYSSRVVKETMSDFSKQKYVPENSGFQDTACLTALLNAYTNKRNCRSSNVNKYTKQNFNFDDLIQSRKYLKLHSDLLIQANKLQNELSRSNSENNAEITKKSNDNFWGSKSTEFANRTNKYQILNNSRFEEQNKNQDFVEFINRFDQRNEKQELGMNSDYIQSKNLSLTDSDCLYRNLKNQNLNYESIDNYGIYKDQYIKSASDFASHSAILEPKIGLKSGIKNTLYTLNNRNSELRSGSGIANTPFKLNELNKKTISYFETAITPSTLNERNKEPISHYDLTDLPCLFNDYNNELKPLFDITNASYMSNESHTEHKSCFDMSDSIPDFQSKTCFGFKKPKNYEVSDENPNNWCQNMDQTLSGFGKMNKETDKKFDSISNSGLTNQNGYDIEENTAQYQKLISDNSHFLQDYPSDTSYNLWKEEAKTNSLDQNVKNDTSLLSQNSNSINDKVRIPSLIPHHINQFESKMNPSSISQIDYLNSESYKTKHIHCRDDKTQNNIYTSFDLKTMEYSDDINEASLNEKSTKTNPSFIKNNKTNKHDYEKTKNKQILNISKLTNNPSIPHSSDQSNSNSKNNQISFPECFTILNNPSDQMNQMARNFETECTSSNVTLENNENLDQIDNNQDLSQDITDPHKYKIIERKTTKNSNTELSDTKKKKSRFPIARIKRIMQSDEEIGKVSTTAPVVLSKAIELFLNDLISKLMENCNQKTLKIDMETFQKTVMTDPTLDFLKTLLENTNDDVDNIN